jgi:hypothetical protein
MRDRGFEPRSPGWKPGVVPLDQSRRIISPTVESSAEGEGVEPSRLIARPISSRVPSPIGLPFRSSSRNQTLTAARAPAGGLEPPIVALTRRCLTIWPHRYREGFFLVQSGWPDSNRRSPAPEAGGLARLSHIPIKCPAGVEPAHPPWQGGRLPLHHGHRSTASELSKRPRAPGGTRTHVAALRVRCLRR